jgi:hypothetical protein
MGKPPAVGDWKGLGEQLQFMIVVRGALVRRGIGWGQSTGCAFGRKLCWEL